MHRGVYWRFPSIPKGRGSKIAVTTPVETVTPFQPVDDVCSTVPPSIRVSDFLIIRVSHGDT